MVWGRAGGVSVMEYIILWIVCGIGAALIASSKGRSALGWLLGGLLLGPIGLLIVGFMGRPAPDESTLTKCPYCAEQKEAKVCKHCGRDVEPVSVPAAEAERELGKADGKKEGGDTILFVMGLVVIGILLFLFSSSEFHPENKSQSQKENYPGSFTIKPDAKYYKE